MTADEGPGIPRQLAKERFILIGAKKKIPLEANWQSEKNYPIGDSRLNRHLESGGNVGVLLGRGLVVLDCDVQTCENLAIQLPKTFVVGTSTTDEGFRKKHFYFHCPLTKKRVLFDYEEHIGEVQALGQQCIIPPSVHPSGSRYEVLEDRPVASITEAELLRAISPFSQETTKSQPLKLPEKVIKGDRNNTIFKFACSLRAKGMTVDEIMPACLSLNNVRCEPSLSESELQTIVASAMKYDHKATNVTPEISAEAASILSDPEFFERLNLELDKMIVGEENARFTILLCACGRLVENQHQSSFNLLVNDESGVGKDWVVKHSLKIIPDEYALMRKAITPKVWRYWHNAHFEPEFSWDGKVCYLEDISDSCLNDETFKVMCSSGNSTSTVVINQRVYDILVQGKPVMVVTSASANPSKEQLRRFTILNLDGEANQSKAILRRHARYAANGIVPEYDKSLIEAQKYLRRVKVKVPFAPGLHELFPESIISRTAFPRFLDYIKASAAINQFQREVDGEGFYLATPEDYENARRAFIQTATNRALVPHTKNQKRLLSIIREWFPNSWFSLRDIELKVNFFSESQLRRQLSRLSGDFLDIGEETDPEILKERNSRKPFLIWRLKDFASFSLPAWDELIKDSRFMENVTTLKNMTDMKFMTD